MEKTLTSDRLKARIDYIKANYQSKRVENLVARGKPRMTQRDQWWKKSLHSKVKSVRERAEYIKNWYMYVDAIKACFGNVPITDTLIIEAVFEMPDWWSMKKMESNLNEFHNVKPDWDNIAKGIQDALIKKDQEIGDGQVIKRWANPFVNEPPSVTIYY